MTEKMDNFTDDVSPKAGVPTGNGAVEAMGYFGIKKCGCVVACVVDDPRYAAHTAECVADYISTGYIVARWPLKENLQRLNRCRCATPPLQVGTPAQAESPGDEAQGQKP